ncbi:hypothetical protein ElyMa_001133700 [Elysia marginata]|uniref:EKC/KEOPS complex subunit GON7 n=1 Tax=Elysia marginata TaxID=1093978 RepID=A0AAV4I1M0_9GAST|nr:hypothetical protein ElyMa_001133700 [Elysia marginata]
MAASSAINLTINFLDGTKEAISQPIKPENGEISYPDLLSSINTVQAQCNQVLTKVIEDEKAKRANSNSGVEMPDSGRPDDDEEDDDDEEEDDEEDKEEPSKEPPEKKPKT